MYEYLKKTIYISLLIFFVFLINYSIISFNMIYPEQPIIYLANQTIKNIWDLINIYLHPQFLHLNIPFFRPSGHFLIYQLLTPIIGWHHIQLFFMVSFIFLGFAGFFMIKIYQRLFPPFQFGGIIAFCLYMMHPALSISKLTIMHFDFAYVCFLLWSLLCFIDYCNTGKKYLFISSLFLYAIAVTFKEPALMLGPVMLLYLYLNRHESINNPKITSLIIGAITALLGFYILSAWPSVQYANNTLNIGKTLGTLNAFLTDGIGLTHAYITAGFIAYPNLAWRTIVFPNLARFILWAGIWFSLICLLLVFKNKAQKKYQKSVLFLLISASLYMILPLGWGMAAPWHYSLTLVMLSLIMGFSIDYFCQSIKKIQPFSRGISYLIMLLISIATLIVNNANIHKYAKLENGSLALAVNRNAILHPPAIKNKLNKNSIIVVEDSILQNDYVMGASAVPLILTMNENSYAAFEKSQQAFYMKFHHTFSGTLFRYAYLMPSLREEIYPFSMENMANVPNEILYTWLQHMNNLFALGYDKQGNWLDKTSLFKSKLKIIQSHRQLSIHQYESNKISVINQNISYRQSLIIPDEQICAYHCDQDNQCRAFVFKPAKECLFYHSINASGKTPCAGCTIYQKIRG